MRHASALSQLSYQGKYQVKVQGLISPVGTHDNGYLYDDHAPCTHLRLKNDAAMLKVWLSKLQGQDFPSGAKVLHTLIILPKGIDARACCLCRSPVRLHPSATLQS